MLAIGGKKKLVINGRSCGISDSCKKKYSHYSESMKGLFNSLSLLFASHMSLVLNAYNNNNSWYLLICCMSGKRT